MTIQEAKETYENRPGKFEGESAATLYFYNLMMDGEGESCIDHANKCECEPVGECCECEWEYPCTFFKADCEEIEEFGLESDAVHLYEDSQGFVYLHNRPANT